MELLSAFLLGAVLGSFLNVCIWRIPEKQSIIYPPSHCPQCNARLRAYDNVPLLSYLLLRGRCRACGGRISLRYPLVEALMGIMLVLLLRRFGLTPALAAYTAFVAALIVITFIDIDHQIIPDSISLPGIPLGVLCALFGLGPSVVDSVVGLLLGGGLLYAVAAGYHLLTGRDGMGGGDIKLLAMIGAFLGWRGVLVTLLLGSLSGALVGGAFILARRSDARVPIPFGPFLALGAVCALFCGDALIEWYLDLAFAL